MRQKFLFSICLAAMAVSIFAWCTEKDKAVLTEGCFTTNAFTPTKVKFAPGNLRNVNGVWSFAANPYDCTYRWGDTEPRSGVWEHFGWSTTDKGCNYGMYSYLNELSGTFKDWGEVANDIDGGGWRTLRAGEWDTVFNHRRTSVNFTVPDTSVQPVANPRFVRARVNGILGIILFPDQATINTSQPKGVNISDATATFGANNYEAFDWRHTFEPAGCVFLPALGYRDGSTVSNVNNCNGCYWAATDGGFYNAYALSFSDQTINVQDFCSRYYGLSVRLVKDQR